MSEPWEDFATTPAATTEAEAGPWQDFAGQEAGPWTDFKPAADLQPISTGSKVAARAASGLEKGMAMPERAIRAGLDLLGWYKALDAVSGTGNKYQDYNRQWLEYFKQRDQQLSKEDAAIGAQGFGYDVVEGVSRVATELPVQLMGGAAGAVRGAAVKGAALTAGTTSGLTQAADDLAEGRSQLESAAYGATSGLITGLTTGAFGTTGVEAVFAKEGVRGVARRVLDVLKQAGLEGAEEVVDEFQQDLLERTTRQPDKPVADTVNQLLLSGTVGALLGGGMATANAVRPTPGPPANRQAAALEKELTTGDRAPVIERTIEGEPTPTVEREAARLAREQREATRGMGAAVQRAREQYQQQQDLAGAIAQVRQDILNRQSPKTWQPLSPTPETTPILKAAEPSRPAQTTQAASQPGVGDISADASRVTPQAAAVSPEAAAAKVALREWTSAESDPMLEQKNKAEFLSRLPPSERKAWGQHFEQWGIDQTLVSRVEFLEDALQQSTSKSPVDLLGALQAEALRAKLPLPDYWQKLEAAYSKLPRSPSTILNPPSSTAKAGASPGRPPAQAEAGSTPGTGSIKVTERHLKEARAALASTERAPDILDELEGQGRTGMVRLPAADFASTLADVRDAVAELLYKQPYAKLRKNQKRAVDAEHRLSLEEGEPVDQVIGELAGNPKYAGLTPDDLVFEMARAVARRNARTQADSPEVKALARQIAEAEQTSAVESWADRTIAEGRKRTASGLDPELLAAYAVKGAYVVARGVRDFAQWSAEMLRQLPDLAKASEAQLRELFARSTDIADGRDPQIGLSIRGMKLRADESLSDAVREGIAAEYQKRTSANDQTEAYRLIAEAGGPEAAAEAIKNGQWNTLPEPVQVKAAGQVLKMLADLERNASDPARVSALADQQIAIANWSTRNATQPAQWLQSFASLYANYSPAAWLKQWRAGVYEVARQRLERATRQAVPENPVGQAQVIAGQVADGLKPDAPTAADVIGDVFGGKGKPGETVEQAVTRRTGKTGEAARKLAKKITDLYEREVAKFRKRHKIPTLTPEEERDVLRRAKELDRLPADSLQRRKAALDLMDALHKRKGFDWYELPVSFWYANVLSGPTTHGKNIIGNAANLGMEAGLQVLLKPTNLPAILEALGRSLPAAARETANILRTGHDTAARHGNKFELRRNPMELQTNPVLNTVLLPWKLVGRFLRAEDAVFFNAAQEMRAAILARRAAGQSTAGMREAMGWTPEARTKAEAQAASEGLTGLDYQRRVTEIIEQARPEAVMAAAREFGYQATYTNDPYGVLGAFTRGIGMGLDYAPAFKPFILPFPRIVANLFNAGLNWTPVGALRAARGQRRLAWLGRRDTLGKLYGREIVDPLAIRDAYARAVVGTAAVLGLIAAAMQNVFDEDPEFIITARGPNSKAQRELLRSAGWIPYSIKIGNRYYSYHDKTPQAILAVVGTYVDAVRYKNLNNEDALNRATYALQSVSGVMVDSSWLQGLSSIFDAAKRDSVRTPETGVARQLIRTGSGFVVPAIVRQVDMFFDPTRFTAPDVQGMLLAQTPFARRTGQPDLNVWGEPISSPTSKIFWSKVEGDALTQRLAGARLFPSLPEQSDLTPAEHYALIKLRGPMLRQQLLENADEWIGQPRMMAQDAVNRISARVTREAKAELGLDEAGRERRELRKMTSK